MFKWCSVSYGICYCLPVGVRLTQRKVKMSKVKVVFEVEVNDNETLNFKYFLQDLLETSTLPALSANLIPLTLNVTQKRG